MLTLVWKRAGWLIILFIGEMLTATAMGYFENEIARAVVLALFVPLIISTAGIPGSQAPRSSFAPCVTGDHTVRLVESDEARAPLWSCAGRHPGGIGFMRIAFGRRSHPSMASTGSWSLYSIVQPHRSGNLGNAFRIDAALHPEIIRSGSGASSAPFVATLSM